MEFEELKRWSFLKVLLRAKSGRGKTLQSCKIALNVARQGNDVLYIDTEAEGSTTMVSLIEDSNTDYVEEDVQNIEYRQANNYDELFDPLDRESGVQGDFDLIVVDTLDHKHSFTLKKVTDEQNEGDVDWNEYPRIYSAEKQLMEQIGKPKTNFICTLDPDSGKLDKPKGAQCNIHGYFNIVLTLTKHDDDWSNSIRNWVGKGEYIGNAHSDPVGKLTEEVTSRIQ